MERITLIDGSAEYARGLRNAGSMVVVVGILKLVVIIMALGWLMR